MRPEEVLMLALTAAAASIHPRPGLAEIRRRIAFDAAMAPLCEQGLLTDHTKTAPADAPAGADPAQPNG